MASRISQMRNAMYPQTPQHQQQQALNESIERTRAIMSQMKGIKDPQEVISRLLQQNPGLGALSNLLRNGQSLEGIAKSMAQMQGADINEVLQQLSNI